ncbi:MAG TPA: dethiobiotin synthase [Methylococcus sp.]|nr:dethiobiotin synthase [Methylococcus sp.]
MKSGIRGLFVTGSDTGVGKTRVGAALARLLVEQGVSVRPRKPVESGCPREAGRLFCQDAWALKSAAESPDPIETVCPYPFARAVAPDRTARLAGISLTIDNLAEACRAGVGREDFLLVEGAGGFYSPLASDGLNADLAVNLGLPVLLVVADRLGCINHTLLTVEAIHRRGLLLAGVILNRRDPILDADLDNAADLHNWLGLPIFRLPYYFDRDSWPQLRSFLAGFGLVDTIPPTQ